MFVVISSKCLDFTGTGEVSCSIVGSCLHSGTGEAGCTEEIRCTTVGGCLSGGIGEVCCTALGDCSSDCIGDVPCVTVEGYSSGDSGWIVWNIFGSSSSSCTSATIKTMCMRSSIRPSLISSPWHCFMCMSRLNFFWNLFWLYLQIFFSACASVCFLLSHYNSLSASWCYAWYLHRSCNFPLVHK